MLAIRATSFVTFELCSSGSNLLYQAYSYCALQSTVEAGWMHEPSELSLPAGHVCRRDLAAEGISWILYTRQLLSKAGRSAMGSSM